MRLDVDRLLDEFASTIIHEILDYAGRYIGQIKCTEDGYLLCQLVLVGLLEDFGLEFIKVEADEMGSIQP